MTAKIYVRDPGWRRPIDEEYSWCLHCERTSRTGDWHMVNEADPNDWDERCPIGDCDGGLADKQPWSDSMARSAHPEYAETPTVGGHYPVY